MIQIKTYQDLLAAGQDEGKRIAFIKAAINDHKSSEAYKYAVNARKYYECENPTIAEYEKIVYDMKGKAHVDRYSANNKIPSSFFEIVVDQEVSYLLRNGISFGKDDTIEKLGKGFERRTSEALENALIAGQSFGFWNQDHLEVFSFADNGSEPGYVPIYDEQDGAMKAGLRYWQIDENKPLRVTLFEMDGLTEYERPKDADMTRISEKKPYKTKIVSSEAGGVEEIIGENYPGFPVVPLRRNKQCRSELRGHRNLIDALDLVASGMVDNSEEGTLLFWVLKNCGGMDDLDDRKFLKNLRESHVVHVDGDDGADADPHTVEAPYQSKQATIDMLTKRLYTDFRAFDASVITAGNQTATAIKACYVPLDLKCDKTEDAVSDFIAGILEIAGIDDKPSYTRNKIINTMEETQNILAGADYFDDEYTTKKLLTINGDADQFDDIQKRKSADDISRTPPKVPPVEEEEEVIEE